MLDGSEDYEKLLPQYRYSKIGEFRTTLTDKKSKSLWACFLHPNRFSIGKATALTKYKLKEQGQDFIPAECYFPPLCQNGLRQTIMTWVLARDGVVKSPSDKVEPYIKRMMLRYWKSVIFLSLTGTNWRFK